ncbi:MAG: histidine utilization repressor [Hyphomicrobiales bacterium]
MAEHAHAQPLYLQVKTRILEAIRSGEWPPGFRVPSENQLVKDLNISRMTINRALLELKDEGYLSRVHGVGTFVRELPHQASLIELKNIAEEVHERGGIYSNKIILLEEIEVEGELAHRFGFEVAGNVFHLVVVHAENGTPLQIEDRYVNPAVAPEFINQDFNTTTPTKYMLSVAPVDLLEHVVTARLPDARTQELLDIPADEPCLVLNRRSWSWGKVATVASLTYPASRYELRAEYRTSPLGTMAETGPSPQRVPIKEVV